MELCRKLRAGGCATMPIMMISARDSLDGKFVCMEVDAEEYSVRLATMNEIESRLRVLFRMNTRLKMNAN
jgi:DNA-binding response OmpR family regulator